MSALFQIVYTSTASDSFSREELVEMLKGSVKRNTRAGITGLLLYQDGTFMQVLEGEESTVIRLFSKISRDPRHHHVITLMHEQIENRYFSKSAMAFRDMDTSEIRNLPGYSEFLNTPLNGDLHQIDIPKSKRLLLLFKKNIGEMKPVRGHPKPSTKPSTISSITEYATGRWCVKTDSGRIVPESP